MDNYQRILQPDESAAAYLARTYTKPVHTGVHLIDKHIPFRAGQILEVAGPSGSGKTQLLLSAAATSILPVQYQGIHCGGHGDYILYLDLDGKFDVFRLLQILEARCLAALTSARTAPSEHPTLAEAIITNAMSRFHLVQCYNSFELLTTLKSLEYSWPVLNSHPTKPVISALFIDNTAAYYHIDRAIRGASGAGKGGPLNAMKVQTAIAHSIRKLMEIQRIPVIASKVEFLSSSETPTTRDLWSNRRETSLKPWQEVVAYRLLLRDGHTAKYTLPLQEELLEFCITASGL